MPPPCEKLPLEILWPEEKDEPRENEVPCDNEKSRDIDRPDQVEGPRENDDGLRKMDEELRPIEVERLWLNSGDQLRLTVPLLDSLPNTPRLKLRELGKVSL